MGKRELPYFLTLHDNYLSNTLTKLWKCAKMIRNLPTGMKVDGCMVDFRSYLSHLGHINDHIPHRREAVGIKSSDTEQNRKKRQEREIPTKP